MKENELHDQLSQMRREAEERDAQRRADSAGVKYLPKEKLAVNVDALALIEEHEAHEAQCAIVEEEDKRVALVTLDPGFSKTKKVIQTLKEKGYDVVLYVVSHSSLEYAYSFYKHVTSRRSAVVGAVKIEEDSEGTIQEHEIETLEKVKESLTKYNSPGSISLFMQALLLGAMSLRASDIHIEPRNESVIVRYRIDGILQDIFAGMTQHVYRAVLSRIKLRSELKINVRDEAQDGRFTIDFTEKRDIEVRVAIAPSEFGEVVVMRLLDPETIQLELSQLGLREDDLAIIEKELKKPHGMILNTGPTGSGKTTTLYAFLKRKHSSEVKIITIENPIEYHIEGIEQTQVDPQAGYTFSDGLKSLMRQDPDIILVGEIRDKETAEIAVQASLTGHMVFSTVHANESTGGIPRLLDLGAKANSLAPALNLIIAQRLVRRLCDACKKEVPLENKETIETFLSSLPKRVETESLKTVDHVYEPVGCPVCNGTGFKGRIGIYELLEINDRIQELILEEAGSLRIKEAAQKNLFVSLQQDGVLKVLRGITTLTEVERVTGDIQWK